MDLYLEEDEELEIVTYNHSTIGPEAWIASWADDYDVNITYHDMSWTLLSEWETGDAMLRNNMDLINDADEVLILWNGTSDELERSFEIARGQEKQQVIIISNNEVDCEVYTEW